jgi:hypothetical protein
LTNQLINYLTQAERFIDSTKFNLRNLWIKMLDARKGKPPERVGRKATGLKPGGDGKAAGLPGGNSTSVECVSVGYGRISTEVLQ